ncbi:PASTA domain-containing protein [Nonomuraea sp. NBC_01738]|uniref:PASTA domain-containing protein n=1 Tax=Nonomuraea sp. NBC_01738 TaxID=2976003 RepID=UPI002E162CE9|nr:PASTA domain-containing protein [Nonomuraea sp. NBC_01738]
MRLSRPLAVAPLLVAVAVTGCTTNQPPSGIVTVTATPPREPVTATPETSAPVSSTPSDPETTTAGAARKKLPNVVGINLQAAQDLLQERGFYLLDDQDATGRHRLQIYDRNWVVVRQTPASGRTVTTDTKVVLWAKKYGE